MSLYERLSADVMKIMLGRTQKEEQIAIISFMQTTESSITSPKMSCKTQVKDRPSLALNVK